MKTEYYEEIKNLIDQSYDPVDSLLEESEYTKKKTLDDVFTDVTNILPSEWIHRSSVYEAMKELGFKSFLYTFPAVEDEEGKVIFPERSVFVYLMDTKTAAI
ncbi:hypothetical protein JM79_2755 [Gramella sp. Hel_I_59]|uniref:hypothetical protein n=1 Tax=Gramella sp. Hel_I_59 TaxID=1249978 RepID=UPI0011509275|nr:hypothetical protein [Gramella sp. Hel_I_59]TQI71806.1 hypothetical protein JM79_2755 [Gramella sp. Hel_I_59]